MSFSLLRDLRDLRVSVVHPPDRDGSALVDHLTRIGCAVRLLWPIPPEGPGKADVVFLAVDHETRPEMARFLKALPNPRPTILAIVGYENPSTLQLVLESGALAVVERPVKPFGLLTNLAVARSLWLEREALSKEARKYKRKVMGEGKLVRAKTILMARRGCGEDAAHDLLRREAMERRVSIEEVAEAVVASESSLRPVSNGG